MHDSWQEPSSMRGIREAMASIDALNLKNAMASPLGDLVEQTQRYLNPGLEIAKQFQSMHDVQSIVGPAKGTIGQAISVADLLGPNTAEITAKFLKGQEIDRQCVATFEEMCGGGRVASMIEGTMNALRASGVATALEEHARMNRQVTRAMEEVDLLGMRGAQQAIEAFQRAQSAVYTLIDPINETLRSVSPWANQQAIGSAHLLTAGFNPDLYVGSAASHLSMRGYANLAAELPNTFAKMDPVVRRGPNVRRHPAGHRGRSQVKRADSLARRELERFKSRWVQEVQLVVRQEVREAVATQKPRFFATYGFPMIMAVAGALLEPVGVYVSDLVFDAIHHEPLPSPQTVPPRSPLSTHLVINRVETDAVRIQKIIIVAGDPAPITHGAETKKHPTRH